MKTKNKKPVVESNENSVEAFPEETKSPEAVVNDAAPTTTVEDDAHTMNVGDSEASSSAPQTINLESSKATLAKRPWRLGAVKVPATKNGTQVEVWVAAVIDQNGNVVCCGDTVDMEFIIKLENSYDNILKAINASGKSLSEAVEVLQDFECKKTKAFKFD